MQLLPGTKSRQCRVVSTKRPSLDPTSLLLVLAVLSFIYISPSTLILGGWRYAGGGTEFEKVHPGTYILILAFPVCFLLDQQFSRKIVSQVKGDWGVLAFFVASLATSAYAVLDKHCSATPFLETFGATILVLLAFVGISDGGITLFRRGVDLFMIVNIPIIVAEYFAHRNFIPVYEYVVGSNAAQYYSELGRPAALFGHPLLAAGFLCIYSLAILLEQFATPRFNVWRLLLAMISFLAAALTGGRTAMSTTIIILLMLPAFSIGKMIFLGSTKSAEVRSLSIMAFAALLTVPIAAQLGLFDLLLGRVQNDNGSSLARYYAIRILMDAPIAQIWTGAGADSLLVQQQTYGLIAIEISWINFILVCGLVFTIPLFLAYLAFLFYSLPRYSRSAYAISIYFLILHASSIGLWAKSTSFAASIAIALAYLGRPAAQSQALRTPRAQPRAQMMKARGYLHITR